MKEIMNECAAIAAAIVFSVLLYGFVIIFC